MIVEKQLSDAARLIKTDSSIVQITRSRRCDTGIAKLVGRCAESLPREGTNKPIGEMEKERRRGREEKEISRRQQLNASFRRVRAWP